MDITPAPPDATTSIHYVEFTPDGASFKTLPSSVTALLSSGLLETHEALSLVDRVPHALRALEIRVSAVARMPFMVEDRHGNDVTYEDWCRPMFRDMVDILDHIERSLTLYGAAYVEITRDVTTLFLPILVPLETPSIQPQYDGSTGQLTHFERVEVGRRRVIPLENMLWVWRPNPQNLQAPGRGLAQTAIVDEQVLWHLSDYVARWFKQGCNRNLIFLTDSMSQEKMRALEDAYQQHLAGYQNAHKPFVLGRGVEAHIVGTTLNETASDIVAEQAKRNIEAAFGVSGMVDPNDANYATASARRLTFYETTVIPQIERIFSAMNRQWLIATEMTIYALPEQLEVFQHQRLEQAQSLMTATGRPVLTVNEARSLMGYDALPDPQYDRLHDPNSATMSWEQDMTELLRVHASTRSLVDRVMGRDAEEMGQCTHRRP
jgi:hypothetical protein